MKKYLALVLALVMALSLVACGNKTAEEPSGDGDATEAAGRVFWLNFKPEADGTLQKVAAMYTEKTGVPVTIQTAASGTYNETLTAAMDKEAPPTMFVVGNQAAVDTWGDYCYDLTGTPIAGELTTDAYNLYDADGKLCSIGYCYECYGIIVNEDPAGEGRLSAQRHHQLRDPQGRCGGHPLPRRRAGLRRLHLLLHERRLQLALHRPPRQPRVLL